MNFFKNIVNSTKSGSNNNFIDYVNIGLLAGGGVGIVCFYSAWSLYIYYKVKQALKAERQAEVVKFINTLDFYESDDDVTKSDSNLLANT